MPVPNCVTCGNPHNPDHQCRESVSIAVQLFRALHEKDEDCTVGPDGLCVDCGVDHSDPCLCCKGAGFHKPTCFWMSPVMAGMEAA